MREGWRQVRLGDVATRRKDFTPVVPDQLYRVVGVQRSGWGLVNRDPVRGDSMKFDKLMQLAVNDLVYRTITAFEAPSAVVGDHFEGAYVTPQTFPVYRLDNTQILPGYMALLTTSPVFHEEMSSRCVGSVLRRKTLSQSAFESIPVTLPPLHEQKRIVDLIAAVDHVIEAAEGEAYSASDIARNLRRLHFEDLTAAVVRAGSICEITAGKQLQSSSTSGTSTPYIRAGSIADGRLDLTVIKRMFLSEAEREKLALRNGDVLVVEGGNGYGKSAIWRDELNGTVAYQNHVLRLRPTQENYPTEYLSQWARWNHETGRFKPTGTGIPNIGLGRARALMIRYSDSGELPQGIAAALSADDNADTARSTADALRTLRSNLLTALLSGEHEIPASYDRFLEEAA